jgi:hypothetical protein
VSFDDPLAKINVLLQAFISGLKLTVCSFITMQPATSDELPFRHSVLPAIFEICL